METTTFDPPRGAKPITLNQGALVVPDVPIIPFIVGDGIGGDIWPAARLVLDEAVTLAYGGVRSLGWMEVLAGEKAVAQVGDPLPEATIQAIAQFRVAIKGPLATPVGGGMRSLNVALRQRLDLYACLRPVRWIPGVPSPVRHPEQVDMVIFRENTEDIYAGIEFEAGTPLNRAFQDWLAQHHPEGFARIRFPQTAAFSLKPISHRGSERLVRAALRYALHNHRARLTLVHKGNIMKVTEGAFAAWGYDLAETEFAAQTHTRRQYQHTAANQGAAAAEAQQGAARKQGKLLVDDVITDAAFEQALTRPGSLDVIATMNLNGDYLSDALTAQVGGLGMAPGANLNYESQVALFEATHGTAPTLAGKNQANPCSLILSGGMLLRHLGWDEAADMVEAGIQAAVAAGHLTADLARLIPGAAALSTADFGDAVCHHMRKQSK
jgi:isocitrate dehydrogenase